MRRFVLQHEFVEKARQVRVGAGDLGIDGGGGGDPVRNGRARGADDCPVGGDGALEVGEHRGRETVFGEFYRLGGDERCDGVVQGLRHVIEDGVTGVLEFAFAGVALCGEGLIAAFVGVTARRARDDEHPVDDGLLEAVFIDGDAGEDEPLALAERGEDIDAAGEVRLAADKGGQGAPDWGVGG